MRDLKEFDDLTPEQQEVAELNLQMPGGHKWLFEIEDYHIVAYHYDRSYFCEQCSERMLLEDGEIDENGLLHCFDCLD